MKLRSDILLAALCAALLSVPAKAQEPVSLPDTAKTLQPAAADTAIAQIPAAADSLKAAQTPDSAEVRVPVLPLSIFSGRPETADSLRKAYDFRAAVEWCRRGLESCDSTEVERWEKEKALSENGLSMSAFCSEPEVVAKYRFSLEDFCLYYPLAAGSWHPMPEVPGLDSKDPANPYLYAPDGSKTIYFSARDAEGIRNLYCSSEGDSLWSAPRLLNESLTSSEDEIQPWISPDGKSLCFASRGLFGMGGYDLYVSEWNEAEGDWGQPVNLGFPFSSPYDDYFFAVSDDGQYSIFASNRECSTDSVVVYVLEFDSMPLRRNFDTVHALKNLCSLPLKEEGMGHVDTSGKGAIQEDENVVRYRTAMDKVRAVRDSISSVSAGIERLRNTLKSDENIDRDALIAEITQKEMSLPTMQELLTEAMKELQQIEMAFLSGGIVIDPDKLKAEAEREVIGTESNYVFERNEPGAPLDIVFEIPEPAFDYSFQVLETGQFAEDNTLPEGLVYQIQLFASARKVTEKDLKGLSPVFIRAASGGQKAYSAGLFRSYADVLSNLNTAKKAGFRNAMIVAFNDGSQISVPQARKLEASASPALYILRFIPENGNVEAAIALIHVQTDKDISRASDGDGSVYEVGPFRDKAECERLQSALSTAGLARSEIIKTEYQ